MKHKVVVNPKGNSVLVDKAKTDTLPRPAGATQQPDPAKPSTPATDVAKEASKLETEGVVGGRDSCVVTRRRQSRYEVFFCKFKT